MPAAVRDSVTACRHLSDYVRLRDAAKLRDTIHIPIMSTNPANPIHPYATPSVLVVDDNHDSADLLASLLPLVAECTAHSAHSGFQALALGERLRPQVVILDITMPGMGGCEAARRMRALPWGRHARIITVSGWRDHDVDCCKGQAAIDAHLTKPVGIGDLLDALKLRRVSAP